MNFLGVENFDLPESEIAEPTKTIFSPKKFWRYRCGNRLVGAVPHHHHDVVLCWERASKERDRMIVYHSELLFQEYQPINETVKILNLTLTFAPMSLFKWQMYASQQMRNRWTQILGSDMSDDSEDDQDSMKQAILETNPYLLGATIVVSLLHTVFEFLAFKNDIQFWRSRKSMEGLSVRSVLINCVTSFVVLLYILDNETNFVVRISIFIGLLIEMWKIPKCMDVSLGQFSLKVALR